MATKKLTKGQQNLIAKYNLMSAGDPMDPNKVTVRSNPFSGAQVEMNAFMANLYDLVCDKYRQYEMGDHSVVRDYDRLKYLLLHFDTQAYYDLID